MKSTEEQEVYESQPKEAQKTRSKSPVLNKKMPTMEGFNGPVTIFEHEIATKIGTIEELQQTFRKLDREDLRGSAGTLVGSKQSLAS